MTFPEKVIILGTLVFLNGGKTTSRPLPPLPFYSPGFAFEFVHYELTLIECTDSARRNCNLISIEKSSLSFDGRVGVTDHWDADDAENQTTVDRQPDRNAGITFEKFVNHHYFKKASPLTSINDR